MSALRGKADFFRMMDYAIALADLPPPGWTPLSFDRLQKMAGSEMPRLHLSIRHRLGANRLGERTARAQTAAARNIDRAGDLAGERESIALRLRIRLRHGGEQGAGVGMGRPV